jgi:hypothetical protein
MFGDEQQLEHEGDAVSRESSSSSLDAAAECALRECHLHGSRIRDERRGRGVVGAGRAAHLMEKNQVYELVSAAEDGQLGGRDVVS